MSTLSQARHGMGLASREARSQQRLPGRSPAVRRLGVWLGLPLGAVVMLALALGAVEAAVRLEPVTAASGTPVEAVSLQADERLFTLMAALNAAGYDDEANELGMHPVRQAVRTELAGKTLVSLGQWRWRLALCRLIHESKCAHWLLQRGGPPDFARQVEGWWVDAPAFLFLGMDGALRAFYAEAEIARLWQTHRPAYEAEIARYQDVLEPSLQATRDYLRVSAPESGRVVMLPNLLNAYWRGYGPAIGDTSYIISGPAQQPNISLVQHEFMHPVINPLVDANLNAIDPELARRLFDRLKVEVPRGYGSWEGILHECVIRAIQVRLADPAERDWLIRKEESAGLWLVRPLARALEDYERAGVTIGEYMPLLLASLNDVRPESIGGE